MRLGELLALERAARRDERRQLGRQAFAALVADLREALRKAAPDRQQAVLGELTKSWGPLPAAPRRQKEEACPI